MQKTIAKSNKKHKNRKHKNKKTKVRQKIIFTTTKMNALKRQKTQIKSDK